MDFFWIGEKQSGGATVLEPKFNVQKSSDFMVRAKQFYAIWDEENQIWSRDPFRPRELIDQELKKRVAERLAVSPEDKVFAQSLSTFGAQWKNYNQYLNLMPDSYHELDRKVRFSNDVLTKEDYASFKLPYPLIDAPCPAYDRLMSTIYTPSEREKLEWAIGAVITGDSKRIQKFIVLTGDAGSGKSTFLNILEQLFGPYCKVFEAKELGMANNQFSTETLKDNPLVAIQQDGNLSRINDNTKLNSIISHDRMIIHEKHKPAYEIRLDTFLFIASNAPVMITDAKSGLTRRLIDVQPSGNKLPVEEYDRIMEQIPFELSGIAWHCLQRYKRMGKNAYSQYVPVDMYYKTNMFFNFLDDKYTEICQMDYTTLDQMWDMYKQYCNEMGYGPDQRMRKMAMHDELKSYFREYYPTKRFGAEGQKRKVYMGFKKEKFTLSYDDDEEKEEESDETQTMEEYEPMRLSLNRTVSELDTIFADCLAQYATAGGNESPLQKWEKVTTTLKELDTTKVHYILFPDELKNHIVVDFDLKDENGNKSADLNLEAAAKWPATYAEFSKGGAGVHLHYIYDGDPSTLSALYAPGIEIKVFNGKSSLRRKLTYCNDRPVAHISSGLPLKEAKRVVSVNRIQSEIGLRKMIERNLRKEIVPATKPSIDFIYNDLERAFEDGMVYDVRDMRPKILAFANNSSHQADYCLKLVAKMKFCSAKEPEDIGGYQDEDPIVFYDLEVFPNLLIICWKKQGVGQELVRMINPKPSEMEALMQLKLVGFNNRRYDNHIVYARHLGWINEEIYQLSKRLISGSANATFREAYNISYADIYEFSSKRQSLKKFEIELGLHHLENSYPWDDPLDEVHWEEVTDYCCNDVVATEATFEDRYSDFLAHEMLAELTGMTVNANGNTMAARLIFGKERNPTLVYVDLATGKASDPEYQRDDIINAFPGYEFVYDREAKKSKNMYRGTDLGFGGYVYAEPGMYTNVALIDVASMHPHSIIAMNYLGAFTKIFKDLVETRILIKHKDYEAIKDLFDGRLYKYLEDEEKIGNLAYSLKIVINKIYGLTTAKFDNEFKDSRNVNNIVALRGALFMRTLQDEVESRGFTVAHIKTDSIKIPNATPDIIQFCMDFAKKYGYTFELEGVYDRMCLVNNAVYIAKYASCDKCMSMYGYVPGDNKKHEGQWTPTGAQFAHPFVFKTLFSHEKIEFVDMCEIKEVQTSIYLDHNEQLPNVVEYEVEKAERSKPVDKQKKTRRLDISDDELERRIAEGHCYKFVGRIGQFTPVQSGYGGAELLAKRGLGYSAVNGTKGYRWMESEMARQAGLQDHVDLGYYRGLVDDAVANISKFGDFEWFVNDDDPPSESNHPVPDDHVPWLMPCGDPNKNVCEECPEFETCPYLHDDSFKKR